MLHNPREQSLFPRLPLEKIQAMCEFGEEVTFEDGDTLFTEGETLYAFYIVLEGRVRVTKLFGSEEMLLTIHEPGQFTGELSILTGAAAIATGRAMGPTRVLRFSNEQFRHAIADCPELAEPVLRAFAARAREVDASLIQQEKLASLGKMAAGLAHELNNPAAAMVRSSQSMRGAVSRVSNLGLEYDCRFGEAERPIIDEMKKRLREEAGDADMLDPLERSDREEGLSDWLEENGIENGWEMASGLVQAGLTRGCVDTLSGRLSPQTLIAALTWLEADLTTNQLARELESAARRISDLVQAMKQYTYMDQAQFQEIDLHAGLDNTLKIFAYRTKKGIDVRREYDRSLPKIYAHAGELNQVWTNLISNALDAMDGHGILTVKTQRDGEEAVITIQDNGPGISQKIRDRIFEPFFTTKSPGQGTGLGLEITQRIVVNRHNGRIDVESKPGDTSFIVRIPLARSRDHAMYTSQPDAQREAALERV